MICKLKKILSIASNKELNIYLTLFAFVLHKKWQLMIKEVIEITIQNP